MRCRRDRDGRSARRSPPAASFANERKIAASTAPVYTELLRRARVGEVGRGTFISGEARRASRAANRAARASIWNSTIGAADAGALIAKSLAGLDSPENLEPRCAATARERRRAKHFGKFLTRQNCPGRNRSLHANGRQCIAAAWAALCRPVPLRLEALTYPSQGHRRAARRYVCRLPWITTGVRPTPCRRRIASNLSGSTSSRRFKIWHDDAAGAGRSIVRPHQKLGSP